MGDDVAGAGDAGISGTGTDDGRSGGRGSGGRGDDAGGLADSDSEEYGTEEEDGVAPLQGGEGDAEDLPPLPKDPLAEVPLTAFFDLNFEHAVNHRRGVDGSDQRGQKQKARDNLQAIRLLKTCVAENHAPTPAEQQKIALFYGFGGLPYAFRRPNGKIESGWSDVALELEALTTEDELKSLRARTVDAQYTSDAVVSAIWDTVRQALPDDLLHPDEPLAGEQPPAGVQPHAGAQPLQVLEPAVGSGVFLSLAPADVPMEFLAVEMDPITATVTKALHPHEKIFNAPFQKVQFAETVDVVVGNPPFGRSKLLDMDRPDLTRVSPNTHGYFFAKSLDRLRPGGLAIMVVSRYLLDADMPEHRAFRVWLHNQAELVSAVRLPHTVFSKTAFTDVVCDVVALRKRAYPVNVIYEPPTRKMVEDWTKARKKEIKDQEERKATPEELIYPLPDHLPEWILGKSVIAMGPDEHGRKGEVPILGNPWYRDHPDHVLGELSIGWGKGLYRAGAPIVLPLPEFEDIGASLARVLQADVQPGMLEGLDRTLTKEKPKYPVLSVEDMGRRVTPYSVFVVPESARKAALETWKQNEADAPNPDGRIPAPVASRLFIMEDQPLIGMRFPDRVNYLEREKETAWGLVTFAPIKAASSIPRLVGMIELRDTLLDLLDLQRTEERRQTPQMADLRRKLQQNYNRFVKKHQHLRRPVNESLMHNDPSWAMLSGLEIEYTPEVSRDKSRRLGIPRSPEQVVRSEIFERRTQYPMQRVEHVDSAVDAMMVSLSESGRIEPARLLELTGKSLAEIQTELKVGQEDAMAFIAPDGHWEERSQWLSGNIDQKIQMLRNAQEQSKTPDAWKRDMEILESHRPPRISILERTIHLGAFWLPENVVSDFVTHLGGVQPQVRKNPITGEWSVKCGGQPPEYSTDHMSLSELLMALHNHRTIQVTYTKDGKTLVDAEKTSLAVEKSERIRNAWRDWIVADTDRVKILEDQYNDLMNTYRPRSYDGRHLSLPGSSPDIRLRPHQKNAVWRMMQSKSTLLDHVVGAGKTFAAIAGVMEKRRTGQAQKPLVVVPNHLVGQWTKDWLRLYPDARLLVADKDDMAGSHRQVFLAKAAFNDVDAVIVAHSSFDRIPIDAEFYEQYLNREMNEAEDFLRNKISMEGLSVKRMEKKIQDTRARVERLHSQASESRDQGCLNFSEIGFDLLVVDESHNYKNVPYNTTLQNVRGLGNPAGSIKAENMMIKVSQCRDGGSGVVFLTGTPISNTIAEMYLLQKYMAPEKLEEKGIHTFDAWVSLFAQVEEEFAFTLTGSFKSLRTLSTFDNLPELVGMYRDYSDVINQKDISQLLKEQRQHALPMPKIKGGKAEIVVCPMTPSQRRIIGEEVGYDDLTGEPRYAEGSILYRLDHLPKRPGPGEDNTLVIISDLRKAGLDA
ncbi:DEAD/DEAH box helicase family protein, partial [Acidithiobacillus ferrivorans]|nr:DEAD/DEAH box helicase family protein [Acidithiobacillus ferrivorans]